jgi:hypothetical protein
MLSVQKPIHCTLRPVVDLDEFKLKYIDVRIKVHVFSEGIWLHTSALSVYSMNIYTYYLDNQILKYLKTENGKWKMEIHLTRPTI